MVDRDSNRYADVVNKVGQYVYDHRDEPITLDDLAVYTGFSKYHFNRLFGAATGYQLGEFIKRRKLECALYSIEQGNHNITDVALSIGYDSPSSFTRAFSNLFGVTPSDVVRKRLPMNQRGGHQASRTSYKIMLEPELLDLPGKTIYGLSGKGFTDQAFSATAAELYAQLAEQAEDLTYEQLEPVGIVMDNPWVGEQTESRFFAGFSLGLDHCSDNLESFHWQAGRWARFLHCGPHSTLWQTASQVYAHWVVPNDIDLKDVQIVQRYLSNPENTPSDALETELYFALQD